jgi:hypothetical protein
MKAEIIEPGHGSSESLLKVDDGEGLWKGLYLKDHQLEAIHAALTEWKAKREEKPKEPTWRAWAGRDEYPPMPAWFRQKEYGDDGLWWTPTRYGNHNIQFNVGEGREECGHVELFREWEWSPDGVTWSKCGILEP